MTKYRKKPVEIEAKQVPPAPRSEPVPDDLQAVASWCGGHVMSNTSSGEYCVDMSLNRFRALPGDWIVKEVNGEFSVRTSEFFEATYEIVGENAVTYDNRIEELEAKLTDATTYLDRIAKASPEALVAAFGPDADLQYATAIILELKG